MTCRRGGATAGGRRDADLERRVGAGFEHDALLEVTHALVAEEAQHPVGCADCPAQENALHVPPGLFLLGGVGVQLIM